MRNLLIMILLSLGAGCSVYRVDVQQGNTLEAEQVNKLKTGMSREQVAFLLGTPVLQDPFHPDRWDYVFSFKPGGGELRSRHLTLYFQGNSLARIDRSQYADYNTIFQPVRRHKRETSDKAVGGGRGVAPPPTAPGGGGGMPFP
jgi:outer membrane protein assembly factor BamE